MWYSWRHATILGHNTIKETEDQFYTGESKLKAKGRGIKAPSLESGIKPVY